MYNKNNGRIILELLFLVIYLGEIVVQEVYAECRDIKVSVIVPVYNVQRYISLCLDSLSKNWQEFYHLYR